LKRILAVAALLLATTARAQGLHQTYLAGETLDYDLSWSRVSGGAARMTISPIDPDRFRITSIGKSGTFFSRFFKVRDEIESIVGTDDFSTLQYHKVLQEGSKHKDELTIIDEKQRVALRKGKAVKVPQPVFDPLSLMYYVRGLDLTTGRVHEFTIIADGKVYTVSATVGGREKLTTPAGTFNTVVVEPKMASEAGVFKDEQKRLQIWYTDDARRIPVRIRSELNIGAITVNLRRVIAEVTDTEPNTRAGQ
jgi:hypothetical protein